MGAIAGQTSLGIGAGVLLAGLVLRTGQEAWAMRRFPLRFEAQQVRILAGAEKSVSLLAQNDASLSVRIHLVASSPEVNLRQQIFELLKGQRRIVDGVVKPTLAGPRQPNLLAFALGPWGLMEAGALLTPLELHVIPRARYAAWLAGRFLEGGQGHQPMSSTGLGASLLSRRRGVEFDHLREYQPGDSLRTVEWRHSLKFGELFVKDFLDPVSGEVIFLTNLTVDGEDQADELASMLVVSALSAARLGVPVTLLAYNSQTLVLALGPINSRDGLKEALRLSAQPTYGPTVVRMLQAPQVDRLRRWVAEIGPNGVSVQPSLGALLRLELQALEQAAGDHPIEQTVRRLLRREARGASIALMTWWNHDAEALAVALPRLRQEVTSIGV